MRSKQRGVALLIIALILGLATVGFFFSKFSAGNIEQERAAQTVAALAEAKAALLGFAASFEATYVQQPSYAYREGLYGFLPCPEISDDASPEGSMESSCGSRDVNSLGRLPWRSLKSSPLRDGDKECLWYAVSGVYKNSIFSRSEMLNADSAGQFKIIAEDGTVIAGAEPETRAVAVIFAPGAIISPQQRSRATGLEHCGGNYTAANYLDSLSGVNNATVQNSDDRIDTFIVANKSQNFNDRVVFITQEEIRAKIFDQLMERGDFLPKLKGLTNEIARCLAASLPAPAHLKLDDYRRAEQYVSSTLNRGRVPNSIIPCLSTSALPLWKNWKDHFFYARCAPNCTVNGTGSYAGIVFFGGNRLSLNAARLAPPLDVDTKMTIANYLEGCNATNFASGTAFQTQDGDGGIGSCQKLEEFNDILSCINSGTPPVVVTCQNTIPS